MKISAHGKSHAGCIRENNEDAFLVNPNVPIFAVADGLGGLPDGEDASRIAIETLESLFKQKMNGGAPDFESIFAAVNAEVYRIGSSRYHDTSIGTTLTTAGVHGNRLYIGHVGDSAAFLWRSGEMHPLTEEHTMAALYGGSHGNRTNLMLPEYYFHTLTRCVGASDSLETAVSEFELQGGDRLLMCTDGLTKIIAEPIIRTTLGEIKSPKQAVDVLLELALEQGSPDNVAIVVAFFAAEKP